MSHNRHGWAKHAHTKLASAGFLRFWTRQSADQHGAAPGCKGAGLLSRKRQRLLDVCWRHGPALG